MDKIKAAEERYPEGGNYSKIQQMAFIEGWDAALSTHPLQEKIDGLVAALRGIVDYTDGIVREIAETAIETYK